MPVGEWRKDRSSGKACLFEGAHALWLTRQTATWSGSGIEKGPGGRGQNEPGSLGSWVLTPSSFPPAAAVPPFSCGDKGPIQRLHEFPGPASILGPSKRCLCPGR